MTLLIDNYDSFTFNLYQLIEKLGFRCKVVRNNEITLQKAKALKPKWLVISPGPGRPDEAGITMSLIREMGSRRIPVLGVCLGHQAIGQVFGGKIIHAPSPQHGKESIIQHDKRGLFSGLKGPLKVARYHSLIIEKRTLPNCLEITCETQDGLIMGVRHKTLPIEGLQFHPESIATPKGPTLVANFFQRTSQRTIQGKPNEPFC